MDNSKTLKGTRGAGTKGAWNCGFCHSTNVTTLCGCAKSREEAGEKARVEPSLDSITLYF